MTKPRTNSDADSAVGSIIGYIYPRLLPKSRLLSLYRSSTVSLTESVYNFIEGRALD